MPGYMTFDADDFMSSRNAGERVYFKETPEKRETENFLSRKWHSAPVRPGDSNVMVTYGD